jgi:hypothetical protein
LAAPSWPQSWPTARRNQAFAGATSLPYPVLDEAYVAQVLQRLGDDAAMKLPSLPVAWQAFQTLGHRPEEFLRALAQLKQSSRDSGLAPDQLLPVVAATMRSSAADLDLQKVEQLGGLALAIFAWVARMDTPASRQRADAPRPWSLWGERSLCPADLA